MRWRIVFILVAVLTVAVVVEGQTCTNNRCTVVKVREGPPGVNGTNGVNGTSIVGPPGRDGLNSTIPGPAGRDGANGTSIVGPPGRDGANGTSIVGPKGDTGGIVNVITNIVDGTLDAFAASANSSHQMTYFVIITTDDRLDQSSDNLIGDKSHHLVSWSRTDPYNFWTDLGLISSVAITGATGPAGANGTSIVGPPGRDGLNSTIPGPVGATGAPGVNGTSIVGPAGRDGVNGSSIVGPAGRDGINGTSIVGPAGRDGVNGSSIVGPAGRDGINGSSIVGPTGASGKDGVNGSSIVGAPGRDGLNSTVPGPQGVTGAVGPVYPYPSYVYVDPNTGNDLTCDGTFSHPCQTVTQILTIIPQNPAYTIGIALTPGTYLENSGTLSLLAGYSYVCLGIPDSCIFPFQVQYFALLTDSGIFGISGCLFLKFDMDLTGNTGGITPIFYSTSMTTANGLNGVLTLQWFFFDCLIQSVDDTTISTVNIAVSSCRITKATFGDDSVIDMYGGSLVGNITLRGSAKITMIGINAMTTAFHCIVSGLETPTVRTDSTSLNTMMSIDGSCNITLLETAFGVGYLPKNISLWPAFTIPITVQQALDAMATMISNIQLTPGPIGPRGPAGPALDPKHTTLVDGTLNILSANLTIHDPPFYVYVSFDGRTNQTFQQLTGNLTGFLIVFDTEGCFCWTGQIEFAAVPGPTGATGAQGVQGVMGVTGATGPSIQPLGPSDSPTFNGLTLTSISPSHIIGSDGSSNIQALTLTSESDVTMTILGSTFHVNLPQKLDVNDSPEFSDITLSGDAFIARDSILAVTSGSGKVRPIRVNTTETFGVALSYDNNTLGISASNVVGITGAQGAQGIFKKYRVRESNPCLLTRCFDHKERYATDYTTPA